MYKRSNSIQLNGKENRLFRKKIRIKKETDGSQRRKCTAKVASDHHRQHHRQCRSAARPLRRRIPIGGPPPANDSYPVQAFLLFSLSPRLSSPCNSMPSTATFSFFSATDHCRPTAVRSLAHAHLPPCPCLHSVPFLLLISYANRAPPRWALGANLTSMTPHRMN